MTPIGDALPQALQAYYEAIDAGRDDDLLACFAPDALLALPDLAAARETAPRLLFHGHDGIARWLAERERLARGHAVELSVVEGDTCLIEGTITKGERALASFGVSARIGADGRIARYVAFAGHPPARPALAELPAVEHPGDAIAVFHSYLTALQDGRTDEAIAHFSDGALYSHPPYVHKEGGGRLEMRGRAGLQGGFGYRGDAPFRHALLVGGQRGAHAIVECVTRDLPPGRSPGSFISIISLDDRAHIRRYVSFYCEPAVP